MKKQKVFALVVVFVLIAIVFSDQSTDYVVENESKVFGSVESSDNDAGLNVGDEDVQTEDAIMAPSKEEVLAMRSAVLEGMNEAEIDRLTENIKVANLQMEEAYLYDDIFGKLEDENHLYWNYFDQKGYIQIGWEYDGDYSKMQKVCKEENLTREEFFEKYGTPVKVYNRFDARNFMELMSNMRWSVKNEALRNDMQYIIDETQAALETHEVEHVNNIYKVLHDMDYFLLRYGIEDVGKYTQDSSVISTYYGALSAYSEE